MPANAGSTRVVSYTLNCDGLQKTVALFATGFPANSMQTILGGGLSVYSIPAASTVQYIRLSDSTSNGTIVVSGPNQNGVRLAMPTSFQVTADASGNIILLAIGACKGGGSVSGYATVYFS
jgi:hypothetical protein